MKNLKVLIVEDEQKLANLIRNSIKELFFKVAIAKDGIDGIKKFKSFKPDIVISDISMPNLSGLEMCKIIKSNSQTPIIILSAYSQKEMLLEAIDLGISKYFIKPFDIESFIEYLKELSNKINKEKDYTLKVLTLSSLIFSNSHKFSLIVSIFTSKFLFSIRRFINSFSLFVRFISSLSLYKLQEFFTNTKPPFKV